MKVEIITMTPELAEKILKGNKKNRKKSKQKMAEYTRAMRNGDWKENGESMILDKNGLVKDGQHRLDACVITGHTWKQVLVTGVEPDVMHTIDVGKQRSMSDILQLQGVTNATNIAAIISKISPYVAGKNFERRRITNSEGMLFYEKNGRMLHNLNNLGSKIYGKQTIRVVPLSNINFYYYAIAGYDMNEKAVAFLNNICGIVLFENNAASYVFKQFLKAKKRKIRLPEQWKLGMVIKAWNLYRAGDPPVTSIRYDISEPLPEVDKL